LEAGSRADVAVALLVRTTVVVALRDIGSDIAGKTAQGMNDAAARMPPEDKVTFERQKAAAAAKARRARASLPAAPRQ
jgi:hypothetical protein